MRLDEDLSALSEPFSDDLTLIASGSHRHETPFPHLILPTVFPDTLLTAARREIQNELRFTPLETDIFQYHATGDLSNLDELPPREASRLKNLLRIRNAIFRDDFRTFLERSLPGCGPLSATVKDMSIQEYGLGSHLLPHGDEVGTSRRVAFCLDLSPQLDETAGGSMQFYDGKQVSPAKEIDPIGGQLIAYLVEPGKSYHAITEVRRQDATVEKILDPDSSPLPPRLVLSGWFHMRDPPQGDKGKSPSIPADVTDFTEYPESDTTPLPGSSLTPDEVEFLRPWLNPAYLSPATQRQLFNRFGDDSHILLADFFNSKVAQLLQSDLRERERGPLANRKDEQWDVAGPPHLRRYLSLQPPSRAVSVEPTADTQRQLLHHLQTTLLPSPAFRHFLANITQLLPLSHRPIQVRRFRRGEDYTVAHGEQPGADAVLDVCVGLSAPPEHSEKAKKGSKGRSEVPASIKWHKRWEEGEYGGFECYLTQGANDDDEDEVEEGGSAESTRKRSSHRDAALADAAYEARQRFAMEEAAEQRRLQVASSQRRNLKDFEYQYIKLGITSTTSEPSQSPSLPSDVELHKALTTALLSLHGNVNGSFHVDVLHIDTNDAKIGSGTATLRVASPHVQYLTSAISITLKIKGFTFSVLEQSNAFTLNGNSRSGSQWLNDLDAPSGKRRKIGVDADAEDDAQNAEQQPDEAEKQVQSEAADEEEAEDEEDEGEDDDDEEEEQEEEDDSDDSPTLLNLPPTFNTLSVALRDEGTLHFVKYLSASAPADRWDVVGEYSVGAVEEEDEEGKDEGMNE